MGQRRGRGVVHQGEDGVVGPGRDQRAQKARGVRGPAAARVVLHIRDDDWLAGGRDRASRTASFGRWQAAELPPRPQQRGEKVVGAPVGLP
jgi:hypothetical protein